MQSYINSWIGSRPPLLCLLGRPQKPAPASFARRFRSTDGFLVILAHIPSISIHLSESLRLFPLLSATLLGPSSKSRPKTTTSRAISWLFPAISGLFLAQNLPVLLALGTSLRRLGLNRLLLQQELHRFRGTLASAPPRSLGPCKNLSSI